MPSVVRGINLLFLSQIVVSRCTRRSNKEFDKLQMEADDEKDELQKSYNSRLVVSVRYTSMRMLAGIILRVSFSC